MAEINLNVPINIHRKKSIVVNGIYFIVFQQLMEMLGGGFMEGATAPLAALSRKGKVETRLSTKGTT